MAVAFQGRTTWLRQFVASAQAAATAAIDATRGSITLAFGQAVTGAALWLQALIAQVLLLTRASTSTGTDLDSWFADFGFERLGAIAASDIATFSRNTPTLQAVVPVGQIVTTGPGGVQFAVTLDATNAAYNATLNGYVLAPSTSSVTVPIQCATGGVIGNVLASTITSFMTPISGVDSVTNPNTLTNGAAAETDAAALARFPLYLESLRTSDIAAIEYAVETTPGVTRYLPVENLSYAALNYKPGYFFVIIDDGTGNPSADLLNTVAANIDAVRGGGIPFSVHGPTIVMVDVELDIEIADGYVASTVQGIVQTAITNFLSGASLETPSVDVAKINQVAMNASPGVINVPFSAILINGENADLTLNQIQAPVPGTITVTVAS